MSEVFYSGSTRFVNQSGSTKLYLQQLNCTQSLTTQWFKNVYDLTLFVCESKPGRIDNDEKPIRFWKNIQWQLFCKIVTFSFHSSIEAKTWFLSVTLQVSRQREKNRLNTPLQKWSTSLPQMVNLLKQVICNSCDYQSRHLECYGRNRKKNSS